MDEFDVVNKARQLVRLTNPRGTKADLNAYLENVNAKVRVEHDFADDESGSSVQMPSGKWCISVNGKHDETRQRFTICHEIAHIKLGLPSEHQHPEWNYTGRSQNEIFCDVFAAELLLPFQQFQALVDGCDIGLAAIDELAGEFAASSMSTASRFAALAKHPCAYVLSEKGRIRYASLSTSLRRLGGRISVGQELPKDSVSARLRAGAANPGAEELEPTTWLRAWDGDDLLIEEARYLPRWDQTIALLWFDDEDVAPVRQDRQQREIEHYGLAELDGNLPWPGKRRRK